MLPVGGRFDAYIRPDRAFAAWSTNADLTVVIGGWPFAEFEANKKDIEGNFLNALELRQTSRPRLRPTKRLILLARGRSISRFPAPPALTGVDRLVVVVDVSLASVLSVEVDMRDMGMGEGGMVMLVAVPGS